MPIDITPDGTGYKIEPRHTTTSPGTDVSFSVSIQGGVRVCFSDPNIWNPSANFFDLLQGSSSKLTSTTGQCTGFAVTTYGGTCPSVSGCLPGDDPPTISTSSPIGSSKHGDHPPHKKRT